FICASSSLFLVFFLCFRPHPTLHSFPTRRSSDLTWASARGLLQAAGLSLTIALLVAAPFFRMGIMVGHDFAFHMTSWMDVKREIDRKSTRLNSSHLVISYAVFCLKKKKKKKK